MHFTPRRTRILLIPVLAATSFALTVPLAAGASSGPTASSILALTKISLANQVGVHVYHVSKSASAKTTIVAEVGKTSGVETITSGAGHVTITVTPSYAYLSGNSAGLAAIMGLTAAQVKKTGAASITFKKGTTPYASLAASATTSLLGNLLPTVKGTTLSTSHSGSSKFYELSWTTKATSTAPKEVAVMTISNSARLLPTQETITASSGSASTTFTKWGEVVNPAKPSTSFVTYAQVFG